MSAGKEDPVEFDSSLMLCNDMGGVAQVGGKCHSTAALGEPLNQPPTEPLWSPLRPVLEGEDPAQPSVQGAP